MNWLGLLETRMNRLVLSLMGAGVVLAFVGCIAGGALPERHGRLFLERHGYATPVIELVVARGILSREQIEEFRKSRSRDVRFLVASNPNLRPQEIDLFLNEKDDYVRSGTAYNSKLSPEQIQKLLRDPSMAVVRALAMNPSVPSDLLLKLHKERNPGLVSFALNPKCPEVLKEEIRRSQDDMAKYLLECTEKTKPGRTEKGHAN